MADHSVPWRRRGMAEVASSAVDAEAASPENEGDMAAPRGL